jgi:hypothetical protein
MEQVPFALAPGLVNHAEVINYSTREGHKLWDSTTKPLSDKFALDHPSLPAFLGQLVERAKNSGWNEILQIPPGLEDINQVVNLTTRYGNITLEQVRAHALTYINGNNRAAQDSRQMFTCIFETLTKSAQSSIMLLKSEYTVGEDNPQVSGPCLLKVVIRKSHVDTNATTSHIIDKLGRIDKIVADCSSNITQANDKVKALIEELAARGETKSHLLNNLFQGYKVASDEEFTAYIKKKHQEYKDGTTDIDADTLMYLAENFYTEAVKNEEWERPSHDKEQIIALEAQIKQLEIAIQESSDKLEANATSITPAAGARPRTNNRQNINARNVKPEWMLKPPASDDPKKKVVNNKDYYWCAKHQAWVRHQPSECQGKGIKPSETDSTRPISDGDEAAPKQLKLSNALTALVEQDEDDFP